MSAVNEAAKQMEKIQKDKSQDQLRDVTAKIDAPGIIQQRLLIYQTALAEGKMTKLAYAIQEAALMPVRHTIKAGAKNFDLWIYPLNIVDFQDVQALISTADKSDDAVMRLCICRSMKDEEGKPVWEKPEDVVTFSAIEWARLRLVIYRVCLGIDLAALTEKG